MSIERLQKASRSAEVARSMRNFSSSYHNKWEALGKPMVDSLNMGQHPRVIAVGPAVIGGLKRLYGKDFGHSGLPGKVFEVTCRKDGSLDSEGLGSVYYGIHHLGIRRMEVWGGNFCASDNTLAQIAAAGIEGFGSVDVRRGSINGSRGYDFKNADAGLLCCSDSRVHPYQIFEGSNVVVVSNAGNVLSRAAVETFIELIEAGVPVLAVLGHSNCGAVGAAMEENKEPMLAEIMRKVRANIDVGNGRDRTGKELLNAAAGCSILGGSTGWSSYELTEEGERLAQLVSEKEVERMAFFMDLTNGRVHDAGF